MKGRRSNFVSAAIVNAARRDEEMPLLRVGDMRNIDGVGMCIWTVDGWEIIDSSTDERYVDLDDEGMPTGWTYKEVKK